MKNKSIQIKEKLIVPPIKCQGIKTKLVFFIKENINWNDSGIWIEPFLGSGVVVFNIRPQKALLSDTNKHIIAFYNDLKFSRIDPKSISDFLKEEAPKLSKNGKEYYYEVRNRFNESPNSLDFLFLNRSCFNGLMRFNSKGEFNVPFGHKPERFRQAYVTKITNQVARVQEIIKNSDWEFVCQDWKKTVGKSREGDFIYIDPPYIGRNTDYFNKWDDDDSLELSKVVQDTGVNFALSMWLQNKYRKNTYITDCWKNCEVRTFNHFYHIGSSEKLRNEVVEALVLGNNQQCQISEKVDLLEAI
ncbi:MAG: Dam family site-specific DNA-(adenine-N6)-methyltransferase [Allomuricauda sp.]